MKKVKSTMDNEDFNPYKIIVKRVQKILTKDEDLSYTDEERIASALLAINLMSVKDFMLEMGKFNDVQSIIRWVLKDMTDETVDKLFLVASEPIASDLWRQLEESGLVDEEGNLIKNP